MLGGWPQKKGWLKPFLPHPFDKMKTETGRLRYSIPYSFYSYQLPVQR
jgi:hypothetical protein